jgi:hypothetical protein
MRHLDSDRGSWDKKGPVSEVVLSITATDRDHAAIAWLRRSEQLGQDMKFTEQEMDIAFAPAHSCDRSADEATRLSMAISSACVIDFFEARGRLSTELVEATNRRLVFPNIRGALGHRSGKASDAMEESLCWLISAAALALLALQIFGL